MRCCDRNSAIAAGEVKFVKFTARTRFIKYKNTRLKKYYGRILFFSTAKEVELRVYREGIEVCHLQKNEKKSETPITPVYFVEMQKGCP